MGTTVGSHIYLRYGWRACASLSVELSAFQLAVLIVRGPHCRRHTWFGWDGGSAVRKTKRVVGADNTPLEIMSAQRNTGGDHLDGVQTLRT
jgi:hypothetical protein